MRWTLLAIVLLSGCAASRHGAHVTRDVHLGEEFSLRIGERARLVDAHPVTFVFEQVIEDSRCAPDVKCIWEGRATIGVRAAAPDAGDSNVALKLDTRGNDATFDGRLHISLVKLAPASAIATAFPDPGPHNDYRATLRVDPER